MGNRYRRLTGGLCNSNLFASALMMFIIVCCTASTASCGGPSTLKLQQAPGQAPLGYIEIQGAGAGEFNPVAWQRDQLNWVPDVRAPFLPPRLSGPFRFRLESPGCFPNTRF